MIEKLYRKAKYEASVKAVTKERCNRCMGTHIYQDLDGQYYCMDCFDYGEISDQMTLYRYQRSIEPTAHRIELSYALTKQQQKGSDFLVACYRDKVSGFLQAVCGAGKTEMTYAVILEALNNNQKVCFVIPRVAVLKEVFKRMKQHFPETTIKALYEGNKDYEGAHLILSTPQQLIYFYDEFSLLIVDEVDAYPFANNPFLHRILEKSKQAYGVVLYMSATITDTFAHWIKSQNLRQHLIPSRYHARPLCIPEFIRLRSKKTIPNILRTLAEGARQTLVFVPTIASGEVYARALKTMNVETCFVSSQSKDKRRLIQSFRNKEIRILLATTILERGVTFADIDCVVIGADHKVFTKETLIQIAGRVGRLSDYEPGRVIFYSDGVSQAMVMARKEIVWMNRQNEMLSL